MTGRITQKSSRRPEPVPANAPSHDPGAHISVTLKLRAHPQTKAASARVRALLEESPNARNYFSREEHERFFGARPGDLARVEAFAHRHDLTVANSDPRKRTVTLRGSVGRMQEAFRVRLQRVDHPSGIFHATRRSPTVPRELAPLLQAVFGFDSRPAVQARRPSRALAVSGATGTGVDPEFVAAAYGFPAGISAVGQCIGIIQLNTSNLEGDLGTGYQASDLETFFESRKIPFPAVTAVGIGSGGNFPGITAWSDREATLDLQVAAAVAPGASFVVYFGANSEMGFYDALAAAIHDSARNPRVISVSWGDVEENYSPDFQREVNQLLLEAATLGITVCVSSGDLGSSGLTQDSDDGKPHAYFPASSPYALACGGTSATFSGAAITEERIWNGGCGAGAGGGGFSKVFPMPTWQAGATAAFPGQGMRGLPDLAAHGDPARGYNIILSGEETSAAGTSAVAPLFAALLARINAGRAQRGRGPVGNIGSLLYKGAAAFRNINNGGNDISGKLGLYTATNGWNPCAGLGAPRGDAFANLLN